MKVQILGSGCAKCKTLEGRVRQLAAKYQLPVEVEKVTDLQEIIKYGILTTPGLVVDGVVKSAGSIPKDDQLLLWMKGTS
ncbi:MAG: thioredoxin family protein [Ignavibacteriae bacterium]|nr:MAG: thioredoxin family protein [Ignavibacteriota bacterium]